MIDMVALPSLHRLLGRGAVTSPRPRFSSQEILADGDFLDDFSPTDRVLTEVREIRSKNVLTKNDSPDLWMNQSINPYQGCEHGCVYCFARPTHEYHDLSPGLDFETKIFFKPDAARLLRQAFEKERYQVSPIALGSNTDIYQPLERTHAITRSLLEVFVEYKHPVALITKSASILRDADLLATLASQGLVSVAISITTLDSHLARHMEPRASTPERRLETLERLSALGIPCTVLTSPMIPGLNDPELENILESARIRGAKNANYVLLRLPHQNKSMFEAWLRQHYPDRADKVLSLIRDTRGGKLYLSEFGTRMRGTGPISQLLEDRFELACRRLGYDENAPSLRTDLFRKKSPAQLPLL